MWHDPQIAEYLYSSHGDRDRLLSFSGQAVTYDTCGRPANYLGKTMEWSRRNLTKCGETEFTYNASGIRTSKTAGGKHTKYFLDGDKILAELCGSDMIIYRCGVDGIAGFEYNGIEYVYRRNIQGDITHIYTLDGTLCARYTYDAWGSHTVENLAGSIGDINPMRYRGYYYDSETGLYYLNSRYYDPIVGRFISQDDISELQPNQINGLNLWAYCGNNPVMLTDSSGCSPLPWWGKLLIGIGVIAVLAVATVLTAGIAGVGIGAAFSAGFAGAAIGAGASGLAVTIAAGAFAGAVVGAGIGLAMGAITGGIGAAISGGNFWSGVLDGAASGFMMGAITGAVTGGIRGGIAYKNSTPLFRAMSQAEANSIAKSGNFSLKMGEMEGKFFATTKANAMQWGTKFYGESFRVVGTRVLSSGLSNATYFTALDGIGAAYYFSDMAILNAIIRSLWFI